LNSSRQPEVSREGSGDAGRESAAGDKLAAMAAALEGELGMPQIAIEPAEAGHSNLTYFLRSGDRNLVLRRPPLPPYAASAHDVLREYRILAALRDTAVRVPQVVCSCADPTVIGAPFYVMERIDGKIVSEVTPPPLDNPDDRRRMGESLIDGLLELHAVHWQGTSLEDIGRSSGYLDRQLTLWSDQWSRYRTRDVNAIDAVGQRLAEDVPLSPVATLVHGDYKLDNVAFTAERPANLVAILDWEMATIGDPLADLGFLTATWLQGDDPDRLLGLSRATAEEGYPEREFLIRRYEEGSGRSTEQIAWYQALALWKLAILLEGSYRRFQAGTTDDPFFALLEKGVPALAAQAGAALDGAIAGP
jgi:aminoglycoside phosphotransferase (APT) family kinase protein